MHTLKSCYRYLKWFVFLYVALTIVVTIKLLNTKGRKITKHEVPLMPGKLMSGDISLKFLRNGTNTDFNHTARYRRAQSNTKLLGKLHELDNIRSQNEHPHMNSLSVTPRQIDSQTGNETDAVQFLPFLKKLTIQSNSTQMNMLNSSDDYQRRQGVKIFKDKKLNPIALDSTKTATEEFLETYSNLCNNKTRRRWEENHNNNRSNNINNSNNNVRDNFCSCVPLSLREYEYLIILKSYVKNRRN